MLSIGRHLRCGFASSLVLAANSRNETSCTYPQPDPKNENYSTDQHFTNWSSTHSCKPLRVYEPESAQEVCRILKAAHHKNEKIRPIGTALSPNGIGMSSIGNVLVVSHIDHIEVDSERKLVTVGAGATVSNVLKRLNEHKLTLENFSSIQEQQMAGWTQVSAHGTGCKLSTVDDMIVRMKLATPTEGLLTLSSTSNPELFSMAKVGLGSLGVVTELTMKCVPQFNLTETTSSYDINDISKQHCERLKQYRHVRYMWLPYTSKVVSVVSNPSTNESNSSPAPVLVESTTSSPPTKPLYELLLSIDPTFDRVDAESKSFSQLRDILLGHAPLDVEHIKKVNKAEAKFWEQMSETRTDDSTNILGFDCGGQQWVYEVCFPIGELNKLSGETKDIQFLKKLLKLIEKHQIPTPCPIEQRWTARSTAPMSPAFSLREDEVFSWVGIIMYMPPNQTDEQRAAITKKFEEYVALVQPLVQEYNAHCHWAKIELPSKTVTTSASVQQSSDSKSWFDWFKAPTTQTYEQKVELMKSRIATKYPVEVFNNYRKVLDPKGILSNELIDTLFGSSKK